MGKSAKKVEKERFDLADTHRSFMNNLESLEMFVNSVAPIAQKHDRATIKKMQGIIKQILKIAGISRTKIEPKKIKKISRTITSDQAKQIAELTTKLPRIPLPQAVLLYRSSFVMLISYFDFLIHDLIHYYYRKYPESLSGKELGLTLSELNFLGGISEAIDFVIDKEIDRVLYDSLEKQKKYFQNILKIDTKDNLIKWEKLIEATERRHIIVHNNCKINRRYLTTVNLSEIPENKIPLKEGAKVQIKEEYFRNIFNEICISGTILLQCCWRKWKKDDIENADIKLNQDIYDLLTKEDWKCAERLGLFSKECQVANQANRLALDVNYCQSLKWQGRKNELDEELKKIDISALSPKFELAICALKSDSKGFYKNVANAIDVDRMAIEDFNEWPLFREFRQDLEYKERISKIFNSMPKKNNIETENKVAVA